MRKHGGYKERDGRRGEEKKMVKKGSLMGEKMSI